VIVSAIVTSGDPNDPQWIIEPADAPFFVSLFNRGECAGTIVGTRHILTAAHCVCNLDDDDDGDSSATPPTAILWNDETYEAWGTFFNPDCLFSCEEDGPNRCDVALLAFKDDLVTEDNGAIALKVYPHSDESINGRKITIYGYGLTGNADNLTSASECQDASEDGAFRRAENIVTDSGTDNEYGVIQYQMDTIEDGGLILEGIAQDGDSGGTAVMEADDGTIYLVGANSGTSESNPCNYGSVDQYAKVSAHFDFISKVMNPIDHQSTDLICPYQTWGSTDANDSSCATSASTGASRGYHYLVFYSSIFALSYLL